MGAAQQAPPAATALPQGLAELVATQFGKDFEISLERTKVTARYLTPPKEPAWTPFLAGDLDGDGVEDAVVVARSKKPLAGEAEFNYKVVDPYFEYHGYGDPKITAEFSTEDPATGHNLLLVIHGSGPEAWRAAVPKKKFVVINLPFKFLSLTQVPQKKGKKMRKAVSLEEEESATSVLFWDGKKYKWRQSARG